MNRMKATTKGEVYDDILTRSHRDIKGGTIGGEPAIGRVGDDASGARCDESTPRDWIPGSSARADQRDSETLSGAPEPVQVKTIISKDHVVPWGKPKNVDENEYPIREENKNTKEITTRCGQPEDGTY